MKNREQGFGHVVAILAVVVVLVVGFTGWRVWDASKAKPVDTSSAQNESTNSNNQTSDKKTYSNPVGKFSVEYPNNWTVKSEVQGDDPDYKSSIATLTSPSGTVLNLNADWGGRGGACEPAAGDIPFAKTNTCASWEYLSSEKTDINNLYYSSEKTKDDGSLEYVFENTADINLVTMRYSDPFAGESYLVGLDDATPKQPIKVNEPQMGFNIRTLFFTVYGKNGGIYPYIYAYAEGDNEAFLSTPDAVTIKEILRTLRVSI